VGALTRLAALALCAATLAVSAAERRKGAPAPKARPAATFDVVEASIADLQKAMRAGRITSKELTSLYLARIKAIDKAGPKLNAVIELNPDALAIAAALDAERKAKGARGPLHGIPILLKDNIATGDRMQTTAGSIALAGAKAPPGRLRRGTAAGSGRGDPGQDPTSPSGRTSARRAPLPDGARVAGSRATRTRSIAMRAARARVPRWPSRRASRPPPWARRRTARSPRPRR
jgi:hypothetical protein